VNTWIWECRSLPNRLKPVPQRPAPLNPPPHPLPNKHTHTHPRRSLPTPPSFSPPNQSSPTYSPPPPPSLPRCPSLYLSVSFTSPGMNRIIFCTVTFSSRGCTPLLPRGNREGALTHHQLHTQTHTHVQGHTITHTQTHTRDAHTRTHTHKYMPNPPLSPSFSLSVSLFLFHKTLPLTKKCISSEITAPHQRGVTLLPRLCMEHKRDKLLSLLAKVHHAHTHTHTHQLHTHIHTHIPPHIKKPYMHWHTYRHTYTHTQHKHPFSHTMKHTHTHELTRTHTHTRTHKHAQTRAHTLTHAHIYALPSSFLHLPFVFSRARAHARARSLSLSLSLSLFLTLPPDFFLGKRYSRSSSSVTASIKFPRADPSSGWAQPLSRSAGDKLFVTRGAWEKCIACCCSWQCCCLPRAFCLIVRSVLWFNRIYIYIHMCVCMHTSENYTCMYMTLNIKWHINFLIRHIIYWKSLINI